MFMLSNVDGAPSSLVRMNGWWKKIWTLKVPQKIKHFVWKCFNNCIPTMVNLRNQYIEVDGICPVCSRQYETTDHVLFSGNLEKSPSPYSNGGSWFSKHPGQMACDT